MALFIRAMPHRFQPPILERELAAMTQSENSISVFSPGTVMPVSRRVNEPHLESVVE